jgi:hypothetical protein
MRFFYLLLFLTMNYSLRLFFRSISIIRSPKEFFGRTIYVSNHPGSFMDPLVIGALRRPIIFFMTRADIFNRFTTPILKLGHMLPIYRQKDDADVKAENQTVFNQCVRILTFGRNLLLFGEGVTDDVFVRRLKPIKKGAIRIGFMALEKNQWKKKIYIAAVGCNYTDPSKMRSDVLIATSEKICLNDYKEQFLEQPNKTMTELTKVLEQLMKEQITHVNDRNWLSFHENVMRLTRKGMSAENYDPRLSLEERWNYSQQLAHWLNAQTAEQLEKLVPAKEEMERYFALLKKLRMNENYVFEQATHGKITRSKEIGKMIVLAPFAVLGAIHCGICYWLVKRFVEKSFKRPVFWSSTKLFLCMIAIGFLNLPVISLFYHVVFPSYVLATAYYASIGVLGLAAYMWRVNFLRAKEKTAVRKIDLTSLIAKRTKALAGISEICC